jgi:calcium binding protein 39
MTSFLNSIGKKKKAHEQLVVTTKQAVQALVDSATQKEEDRLLVLDTVSKSLAEMKSQLCGTSDTPAVDEEKAVELSKHLQQEGVIALLISSLDQLSVETRKDFVSVFGQLLKKNYGGFTDYVATNSNLVDGLMQGYASEAALTYGSLIRECLRYEPLAAYLLSSERLWDFFTSYVHIPNFDTASDAFNTLKELLTVPKHRHVAEEFMQRNCDKLLENYDVRR